MGRCHEAIVGTSDDPKTSADTRPAGDPPAGAANDRQAVSEPALAKRTRPREAPAWVNGLLALFFLYLFLCSINVMSEGLKTLGKAGPWLENLLAWGDQNPMLALFSSVLITAIVQSSSFTTSLIIALVAAGQLKPETAVYCVMGANIGTSVTGIIVALGNIRFKRQFRRAFTAAMVHDIFNLLTVATLFPIEWISSAFSDDGHGLLARMSFFAADLLGIGEMARPANPIKVITSPVVHAMEWVGSFIFAGTAAQGVLVAAVGLVMLFVSLFMMVANLRGALLSRIEVLFSRVFFRNDAIAYTVGAVTTVMVQSSSVSTSLIIPLCGAGAIKIKRVYPFMLGANLGTTVTGVIAATANPVAAAVAVAVSHVSFNLIGTFIWYPLRRVPLGLARWYARLAADRKRYAFIFLFTIFFILPLVAIGLTELVLVLR
jgi:sodium-dependent phosphate cotransporter